jgi:Protein-arginine deiminase (PAD)
MGMQNACQSVQKQMGFETSSNKIASKYPVPLAPPTFVKVPALFFGKADLIFGIQVRSASAFNPGPTNLQAVNGKLYVPIQSGPLVTAAMHPDVGKDILQESIKGELEGVAGPGNVNFIENWYVYHDWFGEVHCGSVVKRQFLSINWWDNQP